MSFSIWNTTLGTAQINSGNARAAKVEPKDKNDDLANIVAGDATSISPEAASGARAYANVRTGDAASIVAAVGQLSLEEAKAQLAPTTSLGLLA